METSVMGIERHLNLYSANLSLVREIQNELWWNPILSGPPQFRITSLNGVPVPGYENLRWMFLKW